MINLDEIIAAKKKRILQSAENEAEHMANRALAIAAAYTSLVDKGVAGLPEEFGEWQAFYGFTVEVTDQEEWGKIHKAIGELEQVGKSPVPKKHKLIEITLTPKNELLSYYINFKFQRKMKDTDKCKIVTVKSKTRREVVCEV